MTKTLLEVQAIENGTVIDHIPSGSLFKVISILGLDRLMESRITFGTNLHSKRMGKKAIIKLSDFYCPDEAINRISIVAPHARINIIKNFEVVEKRNVEVPETVEGFVVCANPKCITNVERNITTRFRVLGRDNDNAISLRCHYCEKTTSL